MAETKPRSKAPAPQAPRTPFKQMTRNQKVVFLLQLVVCICTFGFVFPNLIG